MRPSRAGQHLRMQRWPGCLLLILIKACANAGCSEQASAYCVISIVISLGSDRSLPVHREFTTPSKTCVRHCDTCTLPAAAVLMPTVLASQGCQAQVLQPLHSSYTRALYRLLDVCIQLLSQIGQAAVTSRCMHALVCEVPCVLMNGHYRVYTKQFSVFCALYKFDCISSDTGVASASNLTLCVCMTTIKLKVGPSHPSATVTSVQMKMCGCAISFVTHMVTLWLVSC